jgi:hypothetical protein
MEQSKARFPAPVSLKTATVPADHGLGPDNPDSTKDGRKEPIEPDQQQPVRVRQLQSLGQLADEDVDLLTHHEIVRFQPSAKLAPQTQRILQRGPHHCVAKYPIPRELSLGSKVVTPTSLDKDAPDFRLVPPVGNIVALPLPVGDYIITRSEFEFSVSTTN